MIQSQASRNPAPGISTPNAISKSLAASLLAIASVLSNVSSAQQTNLSGDTLAPLRPGMLFQEDSTPNIFVLVEDRPGRQQLRRVANMDVFWTSGLDPALWPNAVYVNYQASPKAPSEWNPQRDQGPDIVSATELRNLVVFQGEQPAAKRNAAVKAGPNYWIIADGTRRRISNMQVLKPCNSHDNAFNLRRDAHPVSD